MKLFVQRGTLHPIAKEQEGLRVKMGKVLLFSSKIQKELEKEAEKMAIFIFKNCDFVNNAEGILMLGLKTMAAGIKMLIFAYDRFNWEDKPYLKKKLEQSLQEFLEAVKEI